ncbi:uncharacterized protein LOC110924519 [Helianthus annuus]|uniref:uncharacterized protein LOC110924519 n=1 Tax=Helianthus annuus TaxID=4232 RepID=UPI000B909888|nr:uncharacterized protein LOC110924519 [Helianthus annuus]
MPPRRDQTEDLPPTVSEQLSQLITTTNSASTHTNSQPAALIETTANLVTTIAKLSDNLSSDTIHTTSPKPNDDASPSFNNRHSNPKPLKINFTLFDGTNPLGWIFQAENYFTYYRIPPEERVELSVFHFVGDTLSWYQSLHNNDLLGSWTMFKREVELRFGPSSYENHQASLFKLRQTTTVTDYQTEFERISNRVTGLSREALRNCYISGLRQDIQNELAILRPQTLHEACALSRTVEHKLGPVSKPKPISFSKTNTSPWTPPNYSPAITTNPTHAHPKPTQPPLLPMLPKLSSSLAVTRLSPEAIAQRRKDGLCFKCPERYFPGHKCSPPQFLLIVDNEDADPEPVPTMTDNATPDESPQPKLMSLSDTAFFGISSNQTLCVTGYISGKLVQILVDSGSTHSIIQPRIASQLQLLTKPIVPFSVVVGNGQFIQCTGYCPDVQFQVKKTQFQIPFFILPVEGADVVLGISWLSTLGRLTVDFSIPEISFIKDGTPCTLTGEPLNRQVTPSSLTTLLKHNSIASLHTMHIHHAINPVNDNPIPSYTDPTINKLLQDFYPLFLPTHTLPPTRTHDHHIPLSNDSTTVNVKPYRYPHFQKKIMTNLIQEMLQDGIIQPSHNPFSSSVLLVKKKDGSWRFCVGSVSLVASILMGLALDIPLLT